MDTMPLSKTRLEEVDRTTVILQIYHEHDREIHELNYTIESLNLAGEEAFSRRDRAYLAPKGLNTGWISYNDLGLLVIRNEEGLNLLENPTEAEKSDINKRVICLGTSPEDSRPWKIRPGKIFMGSPSDEVFVWSLYQEARFRLTVYPK